MLATAKDYRQLKAIEERMLQDKYEDPDDDRLMAKILKIRETTDFLKYKLEKEKRELARERWKANSVVSVAPQPMVRQNFMSYSPSYHHSVQQMFAPPCYYNNVPPDWGHFNPQIARMPYPLTMPETYAPRMQISNMYKNHLDDVDRMCEMEFVRMQSNLDNLRKVKQIWMDTIPQERQYQRRIRRRIKRRIYYSDETN